MILVVALVVGVALFALVYLLDTSDPAQATLPRFLMHVTLTAGALSFAVLVLPDGGLLIAIAAGVALFGCLTTMLHGLALVAARRADRQ
jgi:hypothetical protein